MRKHVRTAGIAICFLLMAQTASALMVAANIKSLRLGRDVPESTQQQIRSALESENCKFLSGRWVNGHFQFEFAGNADALSGMFKKLSDCPDTSVAVAFRDVKAPHDWQVDLDTRSMQFRITINTNSESIALDRLTIPPPKGNLSKPLIARGFA